MWFLTAIFIQFCPPVSLIFSEFSFAKSEKCPSTQACVYVRSMIQPIAKTAQKFSESPNNRDHGDVVETGASADYLTVC
jgi:hypothetical protein